MINKIIAFASLLILRFTPCFAQFTVDNHTESPLNGKVDSVINVNYQLTTENKVAKKYIATKTVDIYNNKKQLATNYYYLYDGAEKNDNPDTSTYVYDTKGDLLILKIRSKGFYNEINYSDIEKRGSMLIGKNSKGIIDASGKIIDGYGYDTDGKLTYRVHYKYNTAGKLTEQDFYRSDTLTSKHLYEYDQYNNKIKDEEQYLHGDTYTFTYTYDAYDKNHNWIRRTIYKYGTAIEADERHIVYYK